MFLKGGTVLCLNKKKKTKKGSPPFVGQTQAKKRKKSKNNKTLRHSSVLKHKREKVTKDLLLNKQNLRPHLLLFFFFLLHKSLLLFFHLKIQTKRKRKNFERRKMSTSLFNSTKNEKGSKGMLQKKNKKRNYYPSFLYII